jgi:hypothetical protein
MHSGMEAEMRRALLTLFAVSVLSSVAFAQAGLGTWKGEMAGRGGGPAQEVTVMISRGDNGLMGKWMQGDQEEDLANVTAEGSMVSFERTLAGRGGGGQGFTLSYSGEIEGNQLTLTQSFQGGGGARGGAAPGGGGGAARGGAAPGGGGGGARGGGRGGAAPIVLTRQ